MRRKARQEHVANRCHPSVPEDFGFESKQTINFKANTAERKASISSETLGVAFSGKGEPGSVCRPRFYRIEQVYRRATISFAYVSNVSGILVASSCVTYYLGHWHTFS